MTLRTVLLAICGLSLFPGVASARRIIWVLQDVQFSDGGSARGAFVYDVDSDKYSDVGIGTTKGTSRGAALYIVAGPTSNRIMGLFFTEPREDQKGLPGLNLFYTKELTNEGGIVPLAAGFGLEFTCANASCSVFATPQRLVTSGYLEGTPLDAFHSRSSLGSGLTSSDSTLAATLPGSLWIQMPALSSQPALPAAIPCWLTLEPYLRSAISDSSELVA